MSLKVDKDLKTQAQTLAKSMGFPLGTLMNAFLRQFVRTETVYFSLEPTENMTKSLEQKLEKIEQDIAQSKGLSPTFNTMEDALTHLKSA